MNVTLKQNEELTEPVREQVSDNNTTALSDAPDKKAVCELLEVAEREEQKLRVSKKAYHLFLTLWLVGSVAFFVFQGVTNTRGYGAAAMSFVLCGVYLIALLPSPETYSKRLQDAVTALLQFPNEPSLLLPLIYALHITQTTEWKGLLYPALTERLWNLSATDAALSLDNNRRATLRNTLSQAYAIMQNGKRQVRRPNTFDDVTTDLAVAVMKMLAGIGDKASVKVLRKIIQAEAATPNETVVRDAAREYLPVLLKKIAENDEVQRQLRQRAEEPIRDPHKMVEEFVDTLSPETAKVVLVEFLRSEPHGKLSCAGIAVGLGVLACLLPYLGLQNIAVLFAVVVFLLLPSICALLVVANSKWSDQARIVASELAKRSDADTRLLTILLEAARYTKNAKQSDTLKKAFVRLLPLLKPSDAALVPPAQRPYLRSWLKTPRFKKQRTGNASQTLAIAALDALAAIGDTDTSPAAKRIARRTVGGTYRETELHEAALRCMEALQARKEKNRI